MVVSDYKICACQTRIIKNQDMCDLCKQELFLFQQKKILDFVKNENERE